MLTLTNQENCRELARYFSEFLNYPEPSSGFSKEISTYTHLESLLSLQEEMYSHILKLKNSRASAEYGNTAEVLRYLGPNYLKELTKIRAGIWQTEKFPENWRCPLIYPMHKSGNKTDLNNYRQISRLQVTYKILSAWLLQRIQDQLTITQDKF